MNKKLIVLIFFCFPFFSCENQIKEELYIKTTIESIKSDDAKISVFLEASNGTCVDGATVFISDRTNKIAQIHFNVEKYCYSSIIPVPADGLFYFYVDSSLLEKPQDFTISHKQLQKGPVITELRDSEGNSAFSGKALRKQSELLLIWEPAENDATYIVNVSSSFQTLYSCATETTNLTIPPLESVDETNLFITVVAQLIEGDPFLRGKSYYSVSTFPSTSLGFYIE